MSFVQFVSTAWLDISGKTVKDLGYMYGFRVLVVGLLIVFAVLALLWGVLSISKIFLYDIPQKKKAKQTVQSVPAEAPVAASSAENDDALIAVITAAVAAAMEADGTRPAGGFRVVSFTRSSVGSWNRR